MPRFVLFPAALLMTFALDAGPAAGQTPYRKPPEEIQRILDLPAPPRVSLSPAKDTLLFVQTARYPAIADLAKPFLRLAGYRIDPATTGPARGPRVTALTLMPVSGGHPRPIELPQGKVGTPTWNPDGKRFALTVTLEDKIELWVCDVATAKLSKIDGVTLNAATGDPIQWMPDGETLLVESIPANRGKPPVAPAAPPGPTVQESDGNAAPVRTYQDLLTNAHDEAVFEYYATAQLLLVKPGAAAVPFGTPAIFATISPSPAGQFVLISRLRKPFSYLYPAGSFPKTVEVWDAAGKVVKTVAELPLQDKVPIEGVPTGPRQIQWVPTLDGTLVWTEALDGGDPKKKVPHRDQLFQSQAPFAERVQWFKTEHRFAGLGFFPDGDRVVLTDYDRDRRWTRTVIRKNSAPDAEPRLLFDRSIQDRYKNPGSLLAKRLPNGRQALWVVDEKVYLSGEGATPTGDRPFLDRLNLKTNETERLYQSGADEYAVATPLDDSGGKLMILRESPLLPDNVFYRENGKETQVTTFEDPAPELRKIKKQLVTTKRPDGVAISFTLYLPPDYKEGERRPTVFWAYPREFNTADTAGQIVGSPQRFTTLAGYSHLFLLLRGYVVMDEVSVPIVGPPETANDTFVAQLSASAKAAIDKAVEMGAVDRDRIGVGGHSYGAFMTANLLAHTDLFRAGLARSGAYNRTLTPFGFQNERRTFWEAPQVYAAMSPFNHAEKIKEPLLLIHGAADDNPGTFPVQSERLYAAVRGTGGNVRLVLLPHESHSYLGRESIEHVLAETTAWFDKYVKDAKPRSEADKP